MRHSILLSAMVGLVGAIPALGQTYPAEAVVLQKDAEVRSGPSKNFFPTSKLNPNDKVLVLRESKEAPGWLEIKPPTGSFSWINGKNVKQIDARHAYVDCDPARPVSIYAGSTLVNQQPDRESMKLTAGTVLIIVDRPLTINGDTWLPIQPNPSEVRFIPVEAVRPSTTIVATQNSAPKWNLSPNGYDGNSALAEAEKALAANDQNRAKQLFQTVANTTTDQNQKVYALNRLASLQGPPQVPATTTSLSPVNATAPVSLQTLKGPDWTVYGRLRDTKLLGDNGLPLYSLEDATGKTLSYITTSPGKSLQMYIGRTIAVYGPTMYRADSAVRMPYVVASHVAVP